MSKKVLIVEDQFIEANYLSSLLKKAGYKVCGIARSVVIAREMIDNDLPDLVILDIFLSGKLTGIDLAQELKARYIAFIYLSANSNEEVLTAAKITQPCGFLVKPFREKELLIALEISAYRHEHSMEGTFRKEEAWRQQLTAPIDPELTPQQKLLEVVKTIQPFIPFDLVTVQATIHSGIQSLDTGFFRIGLEEYQYIGLKELVAITKKTREEILAFAPLCSNDKPASFFNEGDFDSLVENSPVEKLLAHTFQLRSLLRLPLTFTNGRVGCICLYSKQPAIYNSSYITFYSRLQQLFSSTIESILQDNLELEAEDNGPKEIPGKRIPGLSGAFDGIVGKNHRLLNVFDQIIQVAPTDTSVFILGESGTGKEGIANCIHHLSPRKSKSLIKVNCAALPPSLIESELFGHEKGSFTGATERRIGKFELADKGTIFLDEIGEMPIELQVKLLRVLQEKEVERIGARMPVKVDIRIIAATNRNLEKEISEGRFRLDLYYRLFVFPIMLPPLRERIDDIPALAYHFMNVYNRKAGKKISSISSKVLQAMMDYEWPGNVRELEHLVERSVLLTKGSVIEDISIPFRMGKEHPALATDGKIKTIYENEREYIVTVLKKCNGRIWGTGGAAELLNIPPSTLKSKMNKLGIKKEYKT